MAISVERQFRVGSIDQLRESGCMVTTGGGHTIAVFFHDGKVYAVDNRCPHMGFPLDRRNESPERTATPLTARPYWTG